jgi:hypothetical protein
VEQAELRKVSSPMTEKNERRGGFEKCFQNGRIKFSEREREREMKRFKDVASLLNCVTDGSVFIIW